MRPSTGRRSRELGRRRVEERRPLRLDRAVAAEPGVELEVHRRGRPPARGAAPRAARGRRRPRSTRAATARSKSAPGACSQASIGASTPAARSASASSGSATPSQSTPPRRAPRAPRDGAVPVAVGLHDRHHRGRRDQAAQERRTLCAERGGVDRACRGPPASGRRHRRSRRPPSATTKAVAMPASWLSDRWSRVDAPRAAATRRARRSARSDGCAAGRRATTTMSCQLTPVESPSALMSASFAANRAASERARQARRLAPRRREQARRAAAACARARARTARGRRRRRRCPHDHVRGRSTRP